MPEALAIFAVAVIVVVISIMATLQARDPANFNPQREVGRLQQQVSWLDERLDRAQRENWSPEMIASIAAERAAVRADLERAGRVG